MRILVSGSSGLIGSALVKSLQSQSPSDRHQVVRMSRSSAPGSANLVAWTPEAGVADPQQLEGFDAVVHLAGETVAQRWSAAARHKIKDSRVRGTRALVQALGTVSRKPAVFLCASAVGFYGDRGDETLTESSAPGNGFLAEVCQEWEHSANLASQAGIRTVSLRFGVILSTKGGALAKMLPVFKLGAGGVLGSGRQYISWIHLKDAIRAIEFVMADSAIAGPVNIVAPNPCTNAHFTRVLAGVLQKPAILPVPALAPRLLFGRMADEMLFAGQRVIPERLTKAGFNFEYDSLENALEDALQEH